MSYATVQDLCDAYGVTEMVRVTTPEGADMGGVVEATAQARLDEASDLMDSYLRRRYRTPVDVTAAPQLVLRRCCCDLARKLLRESGGNEASDPVLAAARRQIEWLQEIVSGRVTLDGAVPAGPLSGARVSDRPAIVRGGGPLGFSGYGRGGW